MPDKPPPEMLGKPGQPGIVLYDGVCVLCSGWFRFVSQRDVERRSFFTPIQSAYGRALAQRFGIDADNPQTNAVLIDGKVHLRSDSAITALAMLSGWRWVKVLRIIPRPLRDALYTLIARNRYRWFGRHDACDLGGTQYADRIVG
jgi:predicted DCC family thiol-disulfide oxidoreductase YuxK